MHVQGAHPGNRPVFQTQQTTAATATTATEPTASTATAPETTTAPPETERPRGVIRLLQEGHFKGVADARLRINFHDELAQLSAQAVGAGSAEALDGFTSAAGESIDTLQAALPVAEEQVEAVTADIDAFRLTLGELTAQHTDSGDLGFEALVAQLQSEADNFVAALQTQLEPETADPLLQAFSDSFAELLGQLNTSVTELGNVLPELSEPSGNGGAYAKFVAILEGLNTPEPEVAEEPLLQDVFA